jgi:hypothetical protein
MNMAHRNSLINEKSPYLLQHSHNPVDWYPWGEAAFEKAKREDKPIFLSIGYSTCHWCHVMERESFADEGVASLINDAFISIKVDREERPDIDNVYMTICQLVTGSGGWPLTIIMSPDKKPFFAATFIPRDSRYGQMGMMDLIPRIRELWQTRREDIVQSAHQIIGALSQLSAQPSSSELGEQILKSAYEHFASSFDARFGGFGRAPKFPTPHNLLFLLRYWKRTGESQALDMVEKTLQAIRLGGIYDHLGFGFHRYSTDPMWLVPHFEKMLYDQALLGMAFVETYQATAKNIYCQTARDIFEYVLRDMTAPWGAFYSAEDADSEEEEGKFYLWSEEEIRSVLNSEDAELIIQLYNFESDGNFYDQAAGKRTGANILHLNEPLSELARKLQMDIEQLELKIEVIRNKLFEVREGRPRPYKDDKVLTDWNGLMIAAFALGSQVFDEPRYAEAAMKAADFIIDKMIASEGRLLHRYRDGQVAISGNINDYAFLIWGLINLYEATFDARYLRNALELNSLILEHFWDDASGAFYFTADGAEELLIRPKEIHDGALPSGNSVAAFNLIRLGRISGSPELETKAIKIFNTLSDQIRRAPQAFTMMLSAFDFAVGPAFEIVIAGNLESNDTRDMLEAIRRPFIPNKVVIFRPDSVELPEIAKIAEFVGNKKTLNGKTTAYICRKYQCKAPTTEIARMMELLHCENLL